MQKTLMTLALIGRFSVPGRPHLPVPETASVFDHVTVVDVEHGHLLPDQRVLIVGSRIRAIGASHTVNIPTGAQVIDAHGRYLIPGLWDMHTHSRRFTDIFYPLFLANGITGIRDAWSEVPIDTLRLWRQEILAGTRLGPPRQLLSGPALNEETPCDRAGEAGHICVGDAADARHVVDSLKAAGVDFIKTYTLRRETYLAVAAEARRMGLPFGGHLNYGVATAIEASDSGAWILDHITTAGDLYERCLDRNATVNRCQPVADQFNHANTWFVPTMLHFATTSRVHGVFAVGNKTLKHGDIHRIFATRAAQATLTHFYQFNRGFWRGTPLHAGWLHDSAIVAQNAVTPFVRASGNSAEFFHILARAGLPIMAGTDVMGEEMKAMVPGFALHAELALFVAAGLTPLQALQSVTLNPAKSIHATDSLGTVAAGKLADLVLLDSNPLADITNTTTIHAVMANGRYYDRATLDRIITEVQAKARTEP